MSTLADIKTAADFLPVEQKEELLRFLAGRIRGSGKDAEPLTFAEGKRGFPVSKGREFFTSAHVAEMEFEGELSR